MIINYVSILRCDSSRVPIDTANNHDKTDLLEEILRMKDIAASGGHRHLVRFAGCCTQDDPIYLISECIAHGSLKDLMQRTRQAVRALLLVLFPNVFCQGMQYNQTPLNRTP